MALQAKKLLNELIEKHPDWNWDSVEGQGFMQIMQAFRFAEEGDQRAVVLAFSLVKNFIKRLLLTEEKKRTAILARKLAFENKSYISGFNAGIKEAQIRSKLKKTSTEKRHIEIADKFNIDIQTTTLIWSFVNGMQKSQEDIIRWSQREYVRNKNRNYGQYYQWLTTFVRNLSEQDFTLFIHNSVNSYDKSEGVRKKKIIKEDIDIQ